MSETREGLGTAPESPVVEVGERQRVYVLEQTVTERYYYDPEKLAADFADEYKAWQGWNPPTYTWDDFVIYLFEQYDGSQFCDTLFYNDANPSVGAELTEAWDDE